ncbi:MAG: hypothetical protein KBH07_11960 [Flavobacteriales bacterium]|nr:hypothetical protein [Flavobacteriales bacterium]MBP9081333.1 hypothetical protein [Flavobacteriales bacterium]
MGTLRLTTAILAFALLSFGTATAQQRTLTWNWASTVCGDMLNCNTGCSACNQPLDVLPEFYGTNAAWVGISTCPEPTTTGDNAVFSEGWSTGPEALRKVLLSGMATGPMTLDSIILRHRSAEQGPAWLRVSLKLNLSTEAVLIYEGPVSGEYTTLKLADLGTMDMPEGATAAGFQLALQAFGSEAGWWVLDEVRVVASPGNGDIATGTIELSGKPAGRQEPVYDVLGRPADRVGGLRIRGNGKRQVVVP